MSRSFAVSESGLIAFVITTELVREIERVHGKYRSVIGKVVAPFRQIVNAATII
jgi:hypothetical protein